MMYIYGNPEQKYEIIQATIARDNNLLNVQTLCQIAGVSRSGYYHWVGTRAYRDAKEARDKADFDLILKAYQYRGYKKGARSIHMYLLHRKEPVVMNVKKVRRLMEKFHLFCPIRRPNPYRRAARAFQESSVAPYLLNRQFRLHGPRSVLLTDITYLFYGECRKRYLSVIMDAYTKQALAYVVSPSLEEDFVLETVNQLVRDHGISLSAETIMNSDQGVHYTCCKFCQIVKDIGLRQSMSRKANCWDNAPQESFFGHMKDDINLAVCTTFEQVKAVIDDWMDYYNADRYQWELAKLSPNEFFDYAATGEYPLSISPPMKFLEQNAQGALPPETPEV